MSYKVKEHFILLSFLNQAAREQFISEQDKKEIIKQFSEEGIIFPMISPGEIKKDWETARNMPNNELDEDFFIWTIRGKIKEKKLAGLIGKIDVYCRTYKRGNKPKIIHAIILKHAKYAN